MTRQAIHLERTKVRAAAMRELFGTKPAAVFPHHQMTGESADGPIVDVFVYPLQMEDEEDFIAAVTNGLTDDGDGCELIQYLPTCTPGHALRLLELARLPAAGIGLNPGQIIAGLKPIVPDTPWTNAIFLVPPIDEHRTAGTAALLWYLPISDRERGYAERHGNEAMLAKMDAAGLPMIFDEATRSETPL